MMLSPKSIGSRAIRLLIVAIVLMIANARDARAQTPMTYFACFVPLTGTVYRIKEGTLKPACTSGHIEFSWTDGANAVRTTDPLSGDVTGVLTNTNVVRLLGRALSAAPPNTGEVLTWDGTNWTPAPVHSGATPTNHSQLSGLTNDDHPQYLLDGVRFSKSGFALIQSFPEIDLSPPDIVRNKLIWYQSRGAFRVGFDQLADWRPQLIGERSFAAGTGSNAQGTGAVALGNLAFAIGASSVALGNTLEATGDFSFAFGNFARTNSHVGSIVFSDRSNTAMTTSSAENQFAVRAQHFWFGNDAQVRNPTGQFISTSTGAFLSTGGAWTNASDIALKDGFSHVNADEILQKLTSLPVREWNYKSEGNAVRHIGPTAQDFHSAFGLGNSEKAISTIDADGVSLLAIQALSRRATEHTQQLNAMREDNNRLRAENAELRARLGRIEALLSKQSQK